MKAISIYGYNYHIYEKQIIDMEHACFKGELLFSDEDIKKQVLAGLNIFLLDDNNKIIAATYTQKKSTLTKEDFDGQFDPLDYKREDVSYISSTSVLPEYQNKGIVYALKYTLFDLLRKGGYRYVIGHAKEGKMIHINEKLGAIKLIEYENWYDEGKHFLYEINLYKQHNDYSCGVYATYYFLRERGFEYKVNFSDVYLALNPTKENGTSFDSIKTFLDNYLSEQNSTFNFSLNNTEIDKFPSIINYQDDGDGHYVCALAKYKDILAFYDPQFGKIRFKEYKTVIDNYYSKRYGKGLLIY